jgi:hypothetical protein
MPTWSRCFSKSAGFSRSPVVIVGHACDERLEIDADDRALDSDAVVTLPGQGE